MLGCGTVGTGVYRMLRDNHDAITERIGFPVSVVKIGVRDLTKDRGVDRSLLTADLDSIVSSPDVDVVLELIGGVRPAGELVEKALLNGKSVVTANKELIAKDGSRLIQLAKDRRLDLHFEAAVGGGIPLVQPLKHQLAGNAVLKLMGILNGTCNYILTKMEEEGRDLPAILADAQAKGYAEADPTNDIEGFDTVYKLAVLTSIAFGRQPAWDQIYRQGITKIAAEDQRYAELLGYQIKLLGIVEPAGEGRVIARVHPTLIPKTHPLAGVKDVYNAVWLRGDFVGDVMLSGRGAGSEPTASAVVGDLIDVGRNLAVDGPGSAIPFGTGLEMTSIAELESAYYVRLRVHDEPRVLGDIAMRFGEHEVSLSAMEMKVVDSGQKLGEIVFLTHRCLEGSFDGAIKALRSLPSVRSVEASYRVEDESL